jgi:CRP-like cAMP-binding protein
MNVVCNAPRNHILAGLSSAEQARLRADLEPINLEFHQILEVPNKPIEHCYFIEYGLVSITTFNKNRRIAVGLIGREGATGLPIILGRDTSPHETSIQVAGNALRIPSDKLRRAVSKSRSFETKLLGFVYGFMDQTAATVLSNGTGTVDERLARWLLMAHDRLRGNEVPLTHEALSLMLGVRRAGVTVALHHLEQRGAVRLARKQILVMDRRKLKAAANGSYREPTLV